MTTQVFAEACTYHEAILAFQSGNSIRGHALMRMAVKDGDHRAVEFLRRLTVAHPLVTLNRDFALSAFAEE